MATTAMGWTSDFSVRGMKTEPTFIEHVQYGRQGDRFTLDAVIHGEQVGAFAVDLDPDGRVTVAACPLAGDCAPTPPNGFLSTVAVLCAPAVSRVLPTLSATLGATRCALRSKRFSRIWLRPW
jgi:hypothetical protein